MTRLSSIHLKALLILAISSLFPGAASAVPDVWEAQLGAIVIDATPDPALDDVDNVHTGIDLTFGTMSFPFAGATYTGTDALSIDSNGYISLGGTNVSDPDTTALKLTTNPAPRIAPFWTDLDFDEGGDVFINRFDDDADAAIDRIVVTYAGGHHECSNEDCSVLVQVQLLEDGTIIFGYNGIDLVNPGDTNSSDLLIGISPADSMDPGSTDLSAALPTFDSGTDTTIYELFLAASAPLFDLDDTNLIFTPNLTDGFAVSDSMISPPESTEPPTWETRIGTTIDGQALDNTDDASVDLDFGTMMFPFAGTTYTGADILNISSNGFISIGGDNGSDCCDGDPDILTGDVFPRIAPFWTDLDPGTQGGDIFINRFDEDTDPDIDRIVITFATGHNECDADECSILAQVQLLENGNIIFGYNGIDLTNAADDVTSDLLIGLSPGIGATDTGNTDFSITAPFYNGPADAIYELFLAASAPPFDLDGGNVVFTPDFINGGFDVTILGIGGAAVGGKTGRNSNSGHCSLAGEGAAFDPTLWILMLVAGIYLVCRRQTRKTLNFS